MKAQLFKVWSADNVNDVGLHVAATPEDAAEYYAEDTFDGATGEHKFNVEAEDGTVYSCTVDIQPRAVAFAKPAKKN